MEELRGHASLQRCSGCGKKFERKVALLSHATHCQKKKTVPSEVIHALKRKSLTPMRKIEEKKRKMDDAEMNQMIIRMKSLDARVVLEKTEFPINFDTLKVTTSNKDLCKEDDTQNQAEEEVKSFVEIYKGEYDYDENALEDILNKLHMEVPLDDTFVNSDSEYSNDEPKKVISTNIHKSIIGNDLRKLDSSSDEYDSDDSDIAFLRDSGDDDFNEIHRPIKIENIEEDEETNTEYGDNNELYDTENNDNDEPANDLEETNLNVGFKEKSYLNSGILSDNNKNPKEDEDELVNNASSSSIETNNPTLHEESTLTTEDKN